MGSNLHIHHDFDAHGLTLKKCRVTIVRPAKTAVRLPGLTKIAKEATMLVINQVAGNHRFKSSQLLCAEVKRPWGDTTARGVFEVPAATLDTHWLHAASVLFCKCGLPLYSRVVPVDASSHALAM